jgi:uncharacterized repeat protein (TIGR01451 family)/gliding motility-associated-like protein
VDAVNESVSVLTQIGNEGDEPNTVPSVVTVAQINTISPAISGAILAYETAYQAYIDANPSLFASPATADEVQAMINAVNSLEVLAQIGNEGDEPNTVPSAVTVTQLEMILPALTGLETGNEAAYQAYIDANPALFSSPATATEVQAMVTAVNVSAGVLTQIGNEGDEPNTVPSTVTIAQLSTISPALTGLESGNEIAYQAYIDANPSLFSSPATAAEVQAMVTAVNASAGVLTQIGNEGDEPNTVPSTVTIAQLSTISPALTGLTSGNEIAYQAYIDANPALFSSPATASEVQAMVTAVNASAGVLAQIGNEGDEPNTVPSTVTIAQLSTISPALTGLESGNETAYQAYIDANPSLFSSPATATEVQAMVTAVNTSASVLTQIGSEADAANVIPSTITVAQLSTISPAIIELIAANQVDYQEYIDANPDMFSSPATAAEVQAMVLKVNASIGVDLTITKEVESGEWYEGDEIDYTLTISNNSLGIATNVVVEDYLPSSLKYLSSSINTGTINTEINGQAIRWTLSSLSPGETKVISLRVKAKSISDVKEIQVVNQATIRSQEIELSVNDNTSSVSIVVKAFFAPNVITPNGDGLNDTFVLNGLGKFVSNELIIFNRNGSNVFQTKNYQNDWSAKGLTNGTYLYKITSIDETGKVHTFTGWIQVIGK